MRVILSIIISIVFVFSVSAQEQLGNYLSDAKSSYGSGNLEDTRFALQESLNELYVVISKKILATLPDQLGDAKALSDGDQYNATMMGYTGVFIDRTYANATNDKNIQITLVHDSPLMSGIGSFLASPIMAMATGRKRIKVDGYKAALEKDEGSEDQYTLYIPFSKSLITIDLDGYTSETEVIGLANQLPIAKIVEIAQ